MERRLARDGAYDFLIKKGIIHLAALLKTLLLSNFILNARNLIVDIVSIGSNY